MIEATYIDSMGNDLTVANAARVSFFKTSEMEEDPWGPPKLKAKDAKLIHYLAKHKHISPFGHCFASFHVKAPIFVARQLVKHKFLRWNEVSKRYVDDTPELYTPEVWRGRSADKKQGSEGVVGLGFFNTEGGRFEGYFGEGTLAEAVAECAQDQTGLYDALIKAGVAPEMARMVLPQSAMTEWHWSGSLDALADMCRLRCASDTQYETRVVADNINEEMSNLFPVSWDALMQGEE